MTELDFDELDKAVNSLMKGAPVKKGPNLTDEQTLTIKPTLPENGQPSLNALSAAVADTTSAAVDSPSSSITGGESKPTTSQSSVASRRGRFMDMVRPAAAQPATPSRTSSRQGLTIEPKGPLMTDVKPVTTSQITPVSTVASPVEVTPPTVASENVGSEQSQKTDWPDPLEMADYESTPVSTAKKRNASDEDELTKGISTLQSDSEPLSSPFLPDTKVEKRPLGGSLLASPLVESEQEGHDKVPSTTSKEDLGEQLPANLADSRPGLPEELSTDLMALESDANTIALPADEAKSDAVAQATQATSLEDSSIEKQPVKESAPSKDEVLTPKVSPVENPKQEAIHSQPVAPDHTLPPGPISIPQQYREEPSTGDQNNGAIYDTDAYHQPLAHPKKKKSGWIWVVWTVVFLALGAAGGAALYFLGVF